MKEITVTVSGYDPRIYPVNTPAFSILQDIDSTLTQNAVAARVNGQLWDLHRGLEKDTELEVVSSDSAEGHEVLLHSTAHLMAQAVKESFPQARLAIGPVIENRFYYDFDVDEPFSDEDLERIEERMHSLAGQDFPVTREVMDRGMAREYFRKRGESYKVEMIGEFDDNEIITVYRQDDFVDLCRGPHVPSTGMIKHFKLLKTAGAYWRGDEKNKMLQRIYGTSFFSEEELIDFLKRLEQAKKRDHRKLGRELGLFFFDEMSPGSPFFLPGGTVVYNELVKFVRELYSEFDYEEVITPQIFDIDLWKKSGHWDLFREYLYLMKLGDREFGLKPMNCPGHTILYVSDLRSYRDLPLRFADFGRLHRYERAGVVSGLTRVRSFSQDDAHIFCTPDQIASEMDSLLAMTHRVFDTFGFEEIKVDLSTRPEKALGDVGLWERAEAVLKETLELHQMDHTLRAGEGAFYGPKIDFHIKDALGRYHQLTTIQLDFTLPERFDLKYIARDGSQKRPVMIHRALLGSIERFLGVFIEHCGGDFPLWLAPIQVVVLPVSDKSISYARKVKEAIIRSRLRVEMDERADKIGAKIRDAEMRKIGVMFVVGRKEAEKGTVSVRRRFAGDLGEKSLEAALEDLTTEIREKRRLEISQE